MIMKNEYKDKNIFLIFIGKYWFFGTALFMLGVSIALNIDKSVLTNESIVLTFIGILATFIVVGNYAQVSEIKNEFSSKINDIRIDKEAIEETKKEIEQAKEEIEKTKKEIEQAKEEIEQAKTDIADLRGESYRLLAITANERKLKLLAINYALNALEYFVQSKKKDKEDLTVIYDFISEIILDYNLMLDNSPFEVLIVIDSTLEKSEKLISENYGGKQQIIQTLDEVKKEIDLKYKD